jgi:hypothetical protein
VATVRTQAAPPVCTSNHSLPSQFVKMRTTPCAPSRTLPQCCMQTHARLPSRATGVGLSEILHPANPALFSSLSLLIINNDNCWPLPILRVSSILHSTPPPHSAAFHTAYRCHPISPSTSLQTTPLPCTALQPCTDNSMYKE